MLSKINFVISIFLLTLVPLGIYFANNANEKIDELENENKKINIDIQTLFTDYSDLQKSLEELEGSNSKKEQDTSEFRLKVWNPSKGDGFSSKGTLNVSRGPKNNTSNPSNATSVTLTVGDRLPSFTEDDINNKNYIHTEASKNTVNGISHEENKITFMEGGEIILKNGTHYTSDNCVIEDFIIISGSLSVYKPN